MQLVRLASPCIRLVALHDSRQRPVPEKSGPRILTHETSAVAGEQASGGRAVIGNGKPKRSSVNQPIHGRKPCTGSVGRPENIRTRFVRCSRTPGTRPATPVTPPVTPDTRGASAGGKAKNDHIYCDALHNGNPGWNLRWVIDDVSATSSK